MMGWPGLIRSDKRRYILALLSIVMGGNMSSRLFTGGPWKRGLCYYVHSTVDYYHDAWCVRRRGRRWPRRPRSGFRYWRVPTTKPGKRPVTKEGWNELVSTQLATCSFTGRQSECRSVLACANCPTRNRLSRYGDAEPEGSYSGAGQSNWEELLTPDGLRLALIGRRSRQNLKNISMPSRLVYYR